MIPTGNYILENGIPYTTPFSINKEMGIVIQQWLYDVIIALFSRLGTWGIIFFTVLNIFLLFLTGYAYLRNRGCGKITAITGSLLLQALFTRQLNTPRPEAVTIVLLLLECIGLENYHDSENKKWLWILPVGMILETNLHCSMVLFHFAILLAYLVPVPDTKYCHNKSLWTKRKQMLPAISGMFLCMFLNPYGNKAVTYLIDSLQAGTFSTVIVREVTAPKIGTFDFAVILIVITFVIITVLEKKTDSTLIYLTLGFLPMAFLMIRNQMFLYIPCAAALSYILNTDTGLSQTKSKWVKRWNIPLFIILWMFWGFSLIPSLENYSEQLVSNEIDSQMESFGLDESVREMAEYISENSDTESPIIFAGFNYGGYLEFKGFENIYMDARPELFTKRINKVSDQLTEYADICCDGKCNDADIQDFLDL